ncbi:MAG: repair protein RecO, partial [Pseudomonadota bacterium]
MEWQDDAIVIGVRRLGETDVILEAMTRAHGRHLGVVRGGRSRRLQPALQAGNAVSLSWRARLDEQLGQFVVEPMRMRAAAFMGQRRTLYALTTIASLVRLLPERDPHTSLYEALEIILDTMAQDDLAAPLLVRFEVALLAELGFGLDLSECAATGAKDNLIYV